jgi:hypothetical protein
MCYCTPSIRTPICEDCPAVILPYRPVQSETNYHKAQEMINEVEGISARKPHKCPICNGTGGLYSVSDEEEKLFSACKACKGACVLWG